MSGNTIEVKVAGGAQSRLQDLYEKLQEAVKLSGVNAKVKRGTASGSIGVHTAPKLSIDGKLVSRPESLTVQGLAKLLELAASGNLDDADEPLTLPFDQRFRATNTATHVGDTQVSELVDDTTGVIYLSANGELTPLLHADGEPQRVR